MLGPVLAKPRQHDGTGYAQTHSAIDAGSRLAYSELGDPEATQTCAGLLERAVRSAASDRVRIERILTDNGVGDRSALWAARCSERGITHTRHTPDYQRQRSARDPHARRRTGVSAPLRLRDRACSKR